MIPEIHLLTGRIRGEGLLERLQRFQEILNSRRKPTLGNLLKELRERVALDNESRRVLVNAMEKRNEIVRRFFYKHVVAMITPGGRDDILDSLARSIQIIHGAYELGERIQQQLDARFPLTNRQGEETT